MILYHQANLDCVKTNCGTIPTLIHNQNEIKLIKFMTKGLYGDIYDCSYLGVSYVIKIQAIDEAKSLDCIQREISNQIFASNLGISPKVILHNFYKGSDNLNYSYIMMEKIDACTLESYIYNIYASSDGWIAEHLYDIIRTSDLCTQVRAKINVLQTYGLFHRDLHGSNILIDAKTQVYIVDYGNSIMEKDLAKQKEYKLCDELSLSEFVMTSLP